MIRNTEVRQRHLLLPIEALTAHRGIARRSELYEQEAGGCLPVQPVRALRNASLRPQDIRMVVVTSCTGFMMPSLTAHLINDLGLPGSTVQLPIAQLGCVAGAAAITPLTISPGRDRTVMCCWCPWSFPRCATSRRMPNCNPSLPARCSAMPSPPACCVPTMGRRDSGSKPPAPSFCLTASTTFATRYSIPVFHFRLDKAVMKAISAVAPEMERLSREHFDQVCARCDFFIFHTGGRRILDELVAHLTLAEEQVAPSRASLAEVGSVASVVVFDVLRRLFENPPEAGARGLLAAFGPGFSAEMALGRWTD
ncbi:3-oxoacyl-[acyl-carrier-protein] synthase III C-terminal domain-containing protein [Pseudomonas aeruginosa]